MKMHLFLLVPNNSGSSVLHDLIATSSEVAVLPGEGQFCPNFIGPLASTFKVAHFFTKKEEIFRNKNNYQWNIISNQWRALWKQNNSDAKILLQKSPPDILRTDMLLETFEDTKFIIMIRNPYAMVESILRANNNCSIAEAATHAIRCLEIQLAHSETYYDALVTTYEDLTENTDIIKNKIQDFLGINDIDSDSVFYSKGYTSKIRNMNADQIKRFTNKQLVEINRVFREKQSVLKECGYSLIEPTDFNFKFVANINVEKLVNAVNNLEPELWDEYCYRQNTFDVHSDTRTIPLIFSEDFESENVVYQKHFHRFADEVHNIAKICLEKLEFGYITRAILVKLKANSSIPAHIDAGESLHICHRLHIPLITDSLCKFTVGSETIHMETGDIWEINNTNKLHSVENLSGIDRVHLIVDYIPINSEDLKEE
jgi:Aspartyl/Asparaginyl beta-hydroxylase/Sulfotransferase family